MCVAWVINLEESTCVDKMAGAIFLDVWMPSCSFLPKLYNCAEFSFVTYNKINILSSILQSVTKHTGLLILFLSVSMLCMVSLDSKSQYTSDCLLLSVIQETQHILVTSGHPWILQIFITFTGKQTPKRPLFGGDVVEKTIDYCVEAGFVSKSFL